MRNVHQNKNHVFLRKLLVAPAAKQIGPNHVIFTRNFGRGWAVSFLRFRPCLLPKVSDRFLNF